MTDKLAKLVEEAKLLLTTGTNPILTDAFIRDAEQALTGHEAAKAATGDDVLPIDVYAELVYLRYCHSIGASGADWKAVETKDVWREKALALLNARGV